MTQSILTFKGKVIPCRTLRHLRPDEIHSESEKNERSTFTNITKQKLGDSMSKPPKPLAPNHFSYFDGCDPDPIHLPDDNDPVLPDGTAAFEKPITDHWIHAELNLPQGETLRKAKVIGRAKDINGEVIGVYDNNPLLNTMVYEVEFPDGEIKEYAANVIAENMYSQVDEDGHQTQIMDSLVDYRKDNTAIDKADMYVHTKSGQH